MYYEMRGSGWLMVVGCECRDVWLVVESEDVVCFSVSGFV